MNNQFKTVGLAILLVLFVGGAGILYRQLATRSEQPAPAPQSSGDSDSAPPERVAVPDFHVLDEEGNSVALSSLFGKPIVLNFWASWCPPCKSEMPDFNEVYLEKGEDVHFVMVDLTDGSRETIEKAKEYIASSGFAFPVYFDTEGEAAIAYGITAIPTTVIIDSEGYLVSGTKGPLTKKKLLEGVEAAMQQSEQIKETVATPSNFNPSWCAMEPAYVKITAEDAKRMMGEFEEYILLDVRTQQEYDDKHIDNATLLPYDQIAAKAETVIPDKKAVVFVYCRSGRRSEIAARKLVEMGYNHVYDFGAISDWKD